MPSCHHLLLPLLFLRASGRNPARLNAGADLYLTFDEFGRNAAIPLKYLDEIKKIFGVTKAIPRIIGRAFVQNKLAVIVGVNKEDLPESISCISGKIFENPNEVVVGHELAGHFHLRINDQFSMRGQQKKTFTVVGFFPQTPVSGGLP